MYAAAAGASLGSRQARKQQRKQNNKNQALLQQTLKDKLAATKADKAPNKSRQFHQLPANYLRTPNAQARKLSASFAQQGTSNSRLLLPITESSSVTSSTKNLNKLHHHPHHQNLLHAHNQQRSSSPHHSPHHHRQLSFKSRGHQHHPDCAVHFHGSYSALHHHNQLTKSATATLPLNNLNTPSSPPYLTANNNTTNSSNQQKFLLPTQQLSTLQLATDLNDPLFGGDAEVKKEFRPIDPIIITPATPLPSPNKQNQQQGTGQQDIVYSSTLHVDGGEGQATGDLLMLRQPSMESIARCESPQPPQLERKCSVHRGDSGKFEQKYYYYDDESKLNDNETYFDSFDYNCNTTTVHYSSKPTIKAETVYHANFGPYTYDPLMPNVEGGGDWISPEYCDSDNRNLGICTCDHIECAQGRAAWLERGRKCSIQDQNAASCHRRWVKRNRIHDSSLGGSSDEEDLLGVLRGPSSFANAFLYVGLGTVAIGLVISFVGTGEKGFKTVELRLIGPSLIGIGLICCVLRILFCICPSNCIANRRLRSKKNAKVDAETSLLRSGTEKNSTHGKRVQIARGPNSMQKFPQTHSSHKLTKTNSKTMEGMEALRQIATTSLLMQSESGSKNKQQEQPFMTKKPLPGSTSMNRVVPIINEPEKLTDDEPLEVRNEDSLSIDIYNLSDEEEEEDNDDEDDEEEEEDDDEDEGQSCTSVVERRTSIINAGGGSNLINGNLDSVGGSWAHPVGQRGRNVDSGTATCSKIDEKPRPDSTTITTINEKDHTEIEPGGSRLIMDTSDHHQLQSYNNSYSNNGNGKNQSNSNTFSSNNINSSSSSGNQSTNKLLRQRAPLNISKKGVEESPSSSSTVGATVDSLLMETSLSITEDGAGSLSPTSIASQNNNASQQSFVINLPNAVLTNFSISDNKSDLLGNPSSQQRGAPSPSGFPANLLGPPLNATPTIPTATPSSANSQASFSLSSNFGSPISTMSMTTPTSHKQQTLSQQRSTSSSSSSTSTSFNYSSYSFLTNANLNSNSNGNTSFNQATSTSSHLQPHPPPPPSTSNSSADPELVLSPAKLGQQ